MNVPEKIHEGPNLLSVCIIAWDEEATLRECLESLRNPDTGAFIWDQLMVLIDAKTRDGTMEIADSYGAHVVWWQWNDDYAAARNEAEKHAMGDYVFWIDADERLVSGHARIKQIVERRDPPAVRSYYRDEQGRQHIRQDLLRLRGYGEWVKKIHEYPDCPPGPLEAAIVYEQIQRAVDRPHGPDGDAFVPLRENLGAAFVDRDMIYLARQHLNDRHYQEAIALVDLLLAQPLERRDGEIVVPVQRSHAALLKGIAYEALERPAQARKAYCDALREFDEWAEPWVAMGELLIKLGNMTKAAAYLDGALEFSPIDYGFCDPNVYEWLRYDRLATALAALGRVDEAERYLQIALNARPDDKRIRRNIEQVRGAMIRKEVLA